MRLPIGPAIVGLEPVVLPAYVELTSAPEGGPEEWLIVAPVCRFGSVLYSVQARQPDGSRHHPAKLWLGGLMRDGLECGGQGAVRLPTVEQWRLVTIELELDSYEYLPLDWATLSDADVLEALTSPYAELREAAIRALADRGAKLGRP